VTRKNQKVGKTTKLSQRLSAPAQSSLGESRPGGGGRPRGKKPAGGISKKTTKKPRKFSEDPFSQEVNRKSQAGSDGRKPTTRPAHAKRCTNPPSSWAAQMSGGGNQTSPIKTNTDRKKPTKKGGGSRRPESKILKFKLHRPKRQAMFGSEKTCQDTFYGLRGGRITHQKTGTRYNKQGHHGEKGNRYLMGGMGPFRFPHKSHMSLKKNPKT